MIPPGMTFPLARAMRRSATARSIALISAGVSQKPWIVISGMRSVSMLLPVGTGAAGLATGSGVRPAASSGARAGANTEVIAISLSRFEPWCCADPYALRLERRVQDFTVTSADDPNRLPVVEVIVVVIRSRAKRERECARRLSRGENFRLRRIQFKRCRLTDNVCFASIIFSCVVDHLIDRQDPNIAQDCVADRALAVAVQNVDTVVGQDEPARRTLGRNANCHGALARRQHRGEIAGVTGSKVLLPDWLTGRHAVANDGPRQSVDRVGARSFREVDGIHCVLRPRLPTEVLLGEGLRRQQVAGGD